MSNQALTDSEKMASHRERAARAKHVVFKKICRGLYISHKYGMGLSHESVWSKYDGRKWVLSWSETSGLGLLTPNKRTKKFDTAAEARAYANALVGG